MRHTSTNIEFPLTALRAPWTARPPLTVSAESSGRTDAIAQRVKEQLVGLGTVVAESGIVLDQRTATFSNGHEAITVEEIVFDTDDPIKGHLTTPNRPPRGNRRSAAHRPEGN